MLLFMTGLSTSPRAGRDVQLLQAWGHSAGRDHILGGLEVLLPLDCQERPRGRLRQEPRRRPHGTCELAGNAVPGNGRQGDAQGCQDQVVTAPVALWPEAAIARIVSRTGLPN